MRLSNSQMMQEHDEAVRLLAKSPTGVIHGYSIRWGNSTHRATGFWTAEQMTAAREAEFERMAVEGWTQPRWWQFWRADDTRR